MTITAFQKGNRRPTAGAEKASIYTPNAITVQNVNSVGPVTIQQVVGFNFKGNGQVEVSTPFGFTLPNGVSISSAALVQNSSGSYAAGFHPIVQYSIVATLTANTALANTDVYIVQY